MPSTIDELNLVNAGYVADVYEQYRRDPSSVDPQWRSLFDSGAGGFEPVAPTAQPSADATNGTPQPSDAPKAEPAAKPPSVPEGATPIKGPAATLARNMTASLG